jgi:hypothetical protein
VDVPYVLRSSAGKPVMGLPVPGATRCTGAARLALRPAMPRELVEQRDPWRGCKGRYQAVKGDQSVRTPSTHRLSEPAVYSGGLPVYTRA